MRRTISLVLGLLLATIITVSTRAVAQAANDQTIVTPSASAATQQPRVVIYTLSTCPHCQEAKDYMTSHGIPFVNREVDDDGEHMQELMRIYDEMKVPAEKRGVPLIIISDKVRLQGFNKERFQKELDGVRMQRTSPAVVKP